MPSYQQPKHKTAVFVDIDGTICRYGQKPSHTLFKAFETLRRQGHLAFISTGRSYRDIPPEIHALGFDGVICSLGAYVRLGDNVLSNRIIPPAFLEETAWTLAKNQVGALFCGEEEMVRLPGLRAGKYPARTLTPGQIAGMGETGRFSSIDMAYQNREHMQQCLPALSAHSGVVEFSPNNGQTFINGCDKATGIAQIVDHLRAEHVLTVGIGDSENDIGMLQSADIGVAMGDAPEAVKQAADLVTATVENNGVAKALTHLEIA